ncbi:MAG TPA: hypothetical protein VLO11_09405 [Luteolibacter sp.]|nr:hypothetical protein [Luteolibacter sp.]
MRLQPEQPVGMPETELILLILAVCLLVLLLMQAGRILSRLAGIEARLSNVSSPAEPSGDDAAAVEPSPGGLFESFLEENPSRRELPKNEQFAAFRKWRKDKGLSWSSGG